MGKKNTRNPRAMSRILIDASTWSCKLLRYELLSDTHKAATIGLLRAIPTPVI
jgi:hypothetical protein